MDVRLLTQSGAASWSLLFGSLTAPLVSARSLLDYALESPSVYEFYHTETPSHMRGKGFAAMVATVT